MNFSISKQTKKQRRRTAVLLCLTVLFAGCAQRGDSYADAPGEGIVSLVEEAQNAQTPPEPPEQPEEERRAPLELPVDEYYGDDMALARYEIGLYAENMDALDAAQQGFPWYESLNAADKLLYLEIYQILVSQTRAKIWLSSFDYNSLVEVARLVMTDHPELNMGQLGNEVFIYDDVDGERYWSLALPFPDEEDELYEYALPDKGIQAALRERLGLTEDNMDALYAKHADKVYFQQMTPEEQLTYVEMVQVMELKPEEPLLLTTEIDFFANWALYAIRHDYPIYCYEYINHYAWDEEDFRQYFWVVRHDEKTPQEAQAEEDAAVRACEELVAQMPQGLDDYGKVKWLYDWLVLNTTYTLSMNPTSDEIKSADTLAQTILDRKPICGGYSTTMMYLCNLAGVECWNISGYTQENLHGYHGWNVVKIDGEWYEMDACWGDMHWQDLLSGTYHDYGTIDYTWFLFTTEDGNRYGRVYELFWTPEGTGKNTWFAREGANFASFDAAALRECILRQLRKGEAVPCATVRFETDEAFEAALNYLTYDWERELGSIWSEAGLGDTLFNYNYYEEMRTISIFEK